MAIRDQAFDNGQIITPKDTGEGLSGPDQLSVVQTGDSLLKPDPALANKLRKMQKRRHLGPRLLSTGIFLAGLGLVTYQAWQNPPHPMVWQARQTITDTYEDLLRSVGFEPHPITTHFDKSTSNGTLGPESFIVVPSSELSRVDPVVEGKPNNLRINFPLNFPPNQQTAQFERKLLFNPYGTPENQLKQAQEQGTKNIALFDAPVGTTVSLKNLEGAFIKMWILSERDPENTVEGALIAYPAKDGKIYTLSIALIDSPGFIFQPLVSAYLHDSSTPPKEGNPADNANYKAWTPLTSDNILEVTENPGSPKLSNIPKVRFGAGLMNDDPHSPFVNLDFGTKPDSFGNQKLTVASR